ncbi:MAG TPA: hypothetical protein VMT56_01770 [Candidatus Bathyarchaeia archaeon]|nr:hypothetical protein [Candidatus Bathyarchaeia archaeon]
MITVWSIVRMVFAWVALVAAQMLAGMAIRVESPAVPNVMAWLALADAIIVFALGAAALRSDWRNWTLARALFFIPAAIATVNLIEGAVFLPNAHFDWRGVIALTLATYAVAAVLWYFLFRRAPVAEAHVEAALPHRTVGEAAWRFVLCLACYVVLYFLAGSIIFPYVRDYYATQRVPPVGEIVSLQFFLRGPVFVLVCLTLLRMLRLPHLSGALAVGVTFTLLSGVAPLIIPNAIFPDSVRWVHFGEVTSSNLVFGFIVGWIWGHTEHRKALTHAPA